MSDAEKSLPVASSSAEVDDPDGKNGDPLPHDDVHSGPHHDESLRPYQRTIISMIAPSFLSNVPHPWPAFLCLGFLHVGLFVASFFFFKANCHIIEHFGAEQITFFTWKKLLEDPDGAFDCLYWTGYVDRAGRQSFEDPVNQSTWINETDTRYSFLVPCISQDHTDFMQIYRNARGLDKDQDDEFYKKFFCPGWNPYGRSSEFTRRFGQNVANCTSEQAPTDRSIFGWARAD